MLHTIKRLASFRFSLKAAVLIVLLSPLTYLHYLPYVQEYRFINACAKCGPTSVTYSDSSQKFQQDPLDWLEASRRGAKVDFIFVENCNPSLLRSLCWCRSVREGHFCFQRRINAQKLTESLLLADSLENLCLYHINLKDEQLLELSKLKNLKSVYIGGSGDSITLQGVSEFTKRRPTVTLAAVNTFEPSYFYYPEHGVIQNMPKREVGLRLR